MDEEKEEDHGGKPPADATADGEAEERQDPEIDLAGAAVLLQREAAKALAKYLKEVVDCIITNIKAKHLPSAKLLFELAGEFGKGAVPLEKVESFARTLIRLCGQELNGQELNGDENGSELALCDGGSES